MASIKIEGVLGLDGEYDLDLEHLTNRDHHTIKTVAGVAGAELTKAFESGDLDLVVAMAAIALRKAGKPFVIDQLWDAELGKISMDFTDEEMEDDAGPPELIRPVPPSDESERATSSGPSSNGLSETPVSLPSPTGILP